MKIQVKTLNQKSLLVDIDANKTVLDLKQELAHYPDVGVNPEQQKLIYAGKILENDETLCDCNIDEKKFLVVMVVKVPVKPKEDEGAASTTAAATDSSAKTELATTPTATTITTTPTNTSAISSPTEQNTSQEDEMVANIVSMGYPESEVRQALEASFNNPERAVEYLIEGIPLGGDTGGGFIGDSDVSGDLPSFELLRTDPEFRNLRILIQQNPDLLDEAVQRIGEANPALLTLINERQQEFLSMLFEPSDDDDADDVL